MASHTLAAHATKATFSHLSDKRLLRCSIVWVVSLCVTAFSWHHFQANKKHSNRLNLQMQQSMVFMQDAEQRLHRLKTGAADPLLTVLGEDVTDLQIRLSESFSGSGFHGVQLITAFKQSLLTPIELEVDVYDSVSTNIKNVDILRLDIQASLRHASQFLELIQDLYKATGGWPLEVRACNIRRMPSRTLDAQCVLDIYYWFADVEI